MVENTLYPWAQAIGISLLNLFFIIAVWQAVQNFHQNITLELFIEAFIKIVVANVLFLNMMRLMKLIFSIASLMTTDLFTIQAPALMVDDTDIMAAFFYLLFGFLFIICAIVCSFMILLTVYGRYIKLYMLVVAAPFTVPAMIGGQGTERIFYAWLKTFLLNAFEIVVIALAMVLSWKLIEGGVDIFVTDSNLLNSFNGGIQALGAMFTMILMTVSVKGANPFLARAFGW